jgi:hypothetical protein
MIIGDYIIFWVVFIIIISVFIFTIVLIYIIILSNYCSIIIVTPIFYPASLSILSSISSFSTFILFITYASFLTTTIISSLLIYPLSLSSSSISSTSILSAISSSFINPYSLILTIYYPLCSYSLLSYTSLMLQPISTLISISTPH